MPVVLSPKSKLCSEFNVIRSNDAEKCTQLVGCTLNYKLCQWNRCKVLKTSNEVDYVFFPSFHRVGKFFSCIAWQFNKNHSHINVIVRVFCTQITSPYFPFGKIICIYDIKRKQVLHLKIYASVKITLQLYWQIFPFELTIH